MLQKDCDLDSKTIDLINLYVKKSFHRKFFIDEIKNKINEEDIYETCCLVEIDNNKIKYTGRIKSHLKHLEHRFKHLEYFLSKYLDKNTIKKFYFLFVLNDGRPIDVPCFSIISRPDSKNSCNIPIPMGNDRGLEVGCGTPLINWDNVIYDQIIKYKNQYVWEKKIKKAIFRGQINYQKWKIGYRGKHLANTWEETTRGSLYSKFKNHPLFDIGFTNSYTKDIPLVEFMNMEKQQNYKYIINVGNNVDWAERLRISLFMNSVNIIHESACQEWFQPLMEPFFHYVPTNKTFDDLEKNTNWCVENDSDCQSIVKNANTFAEKYLNENYMFKVFEYTLNLYKENF